MDSLWGSPSGLRDLSEELIPSSSGGDDSSVKIKSYIVYSYGYLKYSPKGCLVNIL